MEKRDDTVATAKSEARHAKTPADLAKTPSFLSEANKQKLCKQLVGVERVPTMAERS